MCNPSLSSASTSTSGPAVGSIPRIGDKVPNFRAMTTHGEIEFEKWRDGKWVVLFSHPADFTPVCSTELVGLGQRTAEFEKRSCKLIGISVDSIHSHLAWIQNLDKITGTRLPFPLVADSDRAVSELFGMIHPGESATATVRALFFIDPKGVVRAQIYYPLNVGRSIDEIVRVLEALQTADSKGVACPANWKPGDKVIVPPPKTMKEVDERLAATYDEKLDFYLCKKTI